MLSNVRIVTETIHKY